MRTFNQWAFPLSLFLIVGIAQYAFGEDWITTRELYDRCTVHKVSETKGKFECLGFDFRPIERQCSVVFFKNKSQAPEINCQMNDFRKMAERCTVAMLSEDEGKIVCP